MPTIGWIMETAQDRLDELAAGTLQITPARARCPICNEEFDDDIAVSWHLNDVHPLERPMMLVAGAPLPSSAMYAVPLDPSTFSFANTTAIRATCNGEVLAPVSPDDLVSRLTSEKRAVFQIELENSRAEDAANVRASYTVMTAIPDPAELEA